MSGADSEGTAGFGTVIPAKVHCHPSESWDLITLALDSKDSCIRRDDD